MPKRLYSIGARLEFQIDVRIGGFVARRAVSHYQKRGIFVGHIQKMVTVSSTRGKCDANAGPDSLAPGIGDEDEFAFDDVNEFILSCVGVPGRRLAARLDTYEVHAVISKPTVIA